jgi:glycosyltransferase involved in cell wall biosynthesis
MSGQPLVSVILPIYNERLDYLTSAVESILRQSHDNIELLIMDDGSGPETAAALDLLVRRDARMRLFRQENKGLTPTLNTLIMLSRGEFIARQDSDDISEPERIERQVAFFASHPKLMLLGTDCLIIDAQGKVLHRQHVETRPHALRRRLRRTNQFVHGSVMFRSAVFSSNCNSHHGDCIPLQYHECIRHAQDYDFFLRISERYEIANIHLPLYRYRINPDSISVAKSRDQLFMGMVAGEAARQRRKGIEFHWSQETYEQIASSLKGPLHQRYLEYLVCSSQGRNLLLTERKTDALRMFWRAFVSWPGPKGLWRLLRTLTPWRFVR